MKASRITVSRLYNLGNYEHIRYEISADVAPEDSAETALDGIKSILDALNPKLPAGVRTTAQLSAAVATIDRIQKMSDDDVAKEFGKSKTVILHEAEKLHAKNREQALAYGKYQAAARAALDDLGGSFTKTDHKQFWDDCDDDSQF